MKTILATYCDNGEETDDSTFNRLLRELKFTTFSPFSKSKIELIFYLAKYEI